MTSEANEQNKQQNEQLKREESEPPDPPPISTPVLFYSVLPSSILPTTKTTRQPRQKKEERTNTNAGVKKKVEQKESKHKKEPQNNKKEVKKKGELNGADPPIPVVPAIQLYTDFQVDIKSWEDDLRYLASLNRCAKSNTSQVVQAGEYIAKRLRAINNIEVEMENVVVKEVFESFNVIGTLKGTTHPDIWFVIGGHYDSTSENIKLAAPGALDNASGTAAVLEMARIFSLSTFPVTLVFILFTGEEQGFFGSKKYVQNMFIKDQMYQIKLMLNMDMISLDHDVIIETREENLANRWEQLAKMNSINPTVSFDIWGSDHVTFANAGVPSILTCSDHTKYKHYHRTTDVADNLDVRAGYNTISMNVQAIHACMKAELEFL